ncbi:MAG: type II toxin-antitoxin system RelE/ParE family toxin [Microbacteriaceae bacterium]|nr:type II toxin-antitoxin system RelE/ParE family toxin [Microbacteriaceae bacterium]
MSYRVEITPKALKQVAKPDRGTRLRIERFLKQSLDRDNPRSQGRALVGEPFWRYRVGDYRLLVSIEDDVLLVLVVDVEHRRSVYRRG